MLVNYRNEQLSRSRMLSNAYDTVSFEFALKTAEMTNFHRMKAEVEVSLESELVKQK